MAVSTTGSLLSSLVFKLKNAPGDAEGFLLGEVQRQSMARITDSQSTGTLEQQRTFIQSFVCFQQKYNFYDHCGKPDFEKIETLLGSQLKQVIGWFSYRRNSSHRISLREKAIHRRLMEGLPRSHSRARDFLFALVTEQTLQQSPVHSTLEKSPVHSTEYSFFQWIGTLPQPVQVNVVNLRASAAVPYHTLPLTHLPSSLHHYSKALEERKSDFVDSEGYMAQASATEKLYRAMIARLEPLHSELARTRASVVTLGSEVSRLQEEVNSIREESEGESEGAGVVGGPEDAEGPEISGGLENIGGLKDTGAPENIGFGVPDTSTVPADEHAKLAQTTETARPVQTGILIDITSDGDDKPPPLINLEDAGPPARARESRGLEGLIIANPMHATEDGILITLAGEEEEGRVHSSGTDSFPQGSQELF